MERQHAVALVMYLNRANGIIPTTGAEWEAIRAALPMIEALANGRVTCAFTPVDAPAETAPAQQAAADAGGVVAE